MNHSLTLDSSTVRVERVSPRDPAVVTLLEALNAHNRAHVDENVCRWASYEDLEQPNCELLGVTVGDRLCAVGAVTHETDYSELKRMFVLPEMRGTGLADVLLDALQERATLAGHSQLCLETSEHFAAAVAFYQKHGFVKCPAFGKYTAHPVNLYLSRTQPPAPSHALE